MARRAKTRAEKQADHDRASWLLDHIRDVPGPPIEWSDGNKIRYLVYRKWKKVTDRGVDDCDFLHQDWVSFDLLRIADRLDELDQAEHPMPTI